MKHNNYPGNFIVFEGLDGSGQSTQANLLRDFFIKNGFQVVLTKEPTLASEAGRKIRKILDEKEKISLQKLQELFAQDRKEHLTKIITPALKKGKIVISDRYFFSSFAYGEASGLALKWLLKINDNFLLPDLIFILKVRPRACIRRIEKRGEKKTIFEKEKKLKKVWQTYKILPKIFKNVYMIKGEGTIPQVFERVKNVIKNKKLAQIIDQTNIKPEATAQDIKNTCREAIEYGFRGVCVNPKWIKMVKSQLKGTRSKVICLVDPPIGDSPHKKRIQICRKAKKDGADETDVVISLPDIKHGRWVKILKDLKEICKILPTKVIIGSGYLTDEEIEKASSIVKKAGAICVKTATAKDPLENRELKEKARHLKIMKKAAVGLLVKASGNIKTKRDAEEMIKAGADIIGTSSGVEILNR